MKRITLALIIVGCVSYAGAQRVDSAENYGSLQPNRSVSPLFDRTAKAKGDILTVIISETSSASFSANTTASKTDSNSVDSINVPVLDMLKLPLIRDILGGNSSGATSSNSGSGSTNHSGRFTARMSVIVRDVLSNGNLVIEGTREVKVNKETHNFVLSGVVRKDDVRSDNTVLSESIADAQIRTEGKGLTADRQRRGIITRILDWLF